MFINYIFFNILIIVYNYIIQGIEKWLRRNLIKKQITWVYYKYKQKCTYPIITEGSCSHAHSHVDSQISAKNKIENRVYRHA